MRKTTLTQKGIIFGKLTTLEEGYFPSKYKIKCLCECGEINSIYIYNLRNGATKSCGCMKGHNLKTHGMKKDPSYKVWCGMKERCNNSRSQAYKNYGGRGITYSKEWEKFENFYEDIGKDRKKGLTLDRIDVNGNYCKENCRWATNKQQGRNRRNNRLYKGKCISEWCESLGLDYKRVINRINKHKWEIQRALEINK